MLTEAFAEDLWTSQYYYCATLFVYESIFVLSILTYVQTVDIHTWPITSNNSSPSISTEFIFFMITKVYFCSRWIANTIVHISLCRWEISGVRKHKKQRNKNEFNCLFLTYRRSLEKNSLVHDIQDYVIGF